MYTGIFLNLRAISERWRLLAFRRKNIFDSSFHATIYFTYLGKFHNILPVRNGKDRAALNEKIRESFLNTVQTVH